MKHRHQKSATREWGLLLLVILAAVVPLIGVGYFLLKSADDQVLAERVRSEEREKELMRVTAKDVEEMVREVQEEKAFALGHLDRLDEWLVSLRSHHLLAGVKIPLEWGKSHTEKKRSKEVSQWLLDPEAHEDELREWLRKGSALYSRAYVLFVLRESGLADNETLVGMERGLLWELDEDDESGMTLKSGGRALLNMESPMLVGPDGIVSGRGFAFAERNYEVGIQRVGPDIGLVRSGSRSPDSTLKIEKASQRRKYFTGGCLLWLLAVRVGCCCSLLLLAAAADCNC